MASSQHVELEAAKFLHKLIQESKDEPAKLATKLYVICQHMKMSGKEQSLPYQVISRAMETVIRQHGLDRDALKSARFPASGGVSDPSTVRSNDNEVAEAHGSDVVLDGAPVGVWHSSQSGHVNEETHGHASQNFKAIKHSNASAVDVDMAPYEPSTSGRALVGPNRIESSGPDVPQDSSSQRSSKSLDQSSPTNVRMEESSILQEKMEMKSDNQESKKDAKKACSKRKRVDNKSTSHPVMDDPQVSNVTGTRVGTKKTKQTIKGEVQGPSGINNDTSSVGFDFKNSSHGTMSTNKQALPATMNTDVLGKFNAGSSSTFNMYAMPKGVGHLVPQTSNSMAGRGEMLDDKNKNVFMRSSEAHFNAASRDVKNMEVASGVRMANPRDMAGTFVSQASPTSNTPFREHQLKQLRAQCLVFLAFRNNMAPRKLHLDIALGESLSREETTNAREVASRGKDLLKNEPSSSNDCSNVFNQPVDASETGPEIHTRITKKSPHAGNVGDAGPLLGEVEESRKRDIKHETVDRSLMIGSSQVNLPLGQKVKMETQILGTGAQTPTVTRVDGTDLCNPHTSLKASYKRDNSDCSNEQNVYMTHASASVIGNKLNLEGNALMKSGMDVLKEAHASSSPSPLQHDATLGRIGMNARLLAQGDSMDTNKKGPLITETVASALQQKDMIVPRNSMEADNSKLAMNAPGGNSLKDYGNVDVPSLSTVDGFKTIIFNETQKNANISTPGKCIEREEQNKAHSNGVPASPKDQNNVHANGVPASPKYTTTDKWIIDFQRKKHLEDHNWTMRQKKAEEEIAKCFKTLKENVSSSEDISKRTRSVIQLKKLQLVKLQRRLRSDFLNDFFKPISSDMERIKSIKKSKHGRRAKQLEKFESKMKEERQKRIKERQKEFFGELEVHRERLEDSLKIKRERWRGFNKHVKEFHKRKERIHREKIDRIQREKINLLKNNDVEGYLRMVQDTKSDRVKQLLKETEKYLQQLGSKLQEAKAMARQFEMEMDENRSANVFEHNDELIGNEDENDEAMHYLESNEKYYLMAHSVKESIDKQPGSLIGGKLREYQMNGLRWLVSLYNNNLNGILADEMGLGKTVQVISLICYLMEMKNDRGPFLVVVPSSVLPGWESELRFWAPGIKKIVYAGPPEERRRLFKEMIVQQKFNVLLTTYEFLMNKHDRPKLSKVCWHYIIIDEGHRIKNASCKLNADLRHYHSSHRLLLTGTPLQNNLEELWALLNFLLPSIFNSAEDFSQWFNKPFESNGDNSLDEALLSEEENLLIINRLHQVLRPFVLRRLKHKVENELPEKIERLIRCEASAYQKLLMKRVEENLGSLGNPKARSVHNTVMELRNICNHPYLSQLHAEEVDSLIPKHYLPPFVRLCGKLEMLDRLLPKLKATNHRVLLFSTMTRLLDVMEEYLTWKQYRYLRLDGHTSGNDRGALIDEFNRPDSATFIFLLSIRAGGVGVNLQAADTVIIFDTDWNPQVDLQAQARAHRIGQKREVLVLRLETVRTVEEQVRAAAEHKLGVANQSITAGFFDNHTSAEDRREYLESLLRESKKEETAHVLDDDALNDVLARSESEIDIFEAIDKQRHEDEMVAWQKLISEKIIDGQESLPMPPRLVTEEDLKPLYLALQIRESSNLAAKRKGESIGSLDTQHYGRGKRAREVRSYEDQWTEEEFEKLCQVESPESSDILDIQKDASLLKVSPASGIESTDPLVEEEDPLLKQRQLQEMVPSPVIKPTVPPVKRGRGRPRRIPIPPPIISTPPETFVKQNIGSQGTSLLPVNDMKSVSSTSLDILQDSQQDSAEQIASTTSLFTPAVPSSTSVVQVPPRVQTRRTKVGEKSHSRAKRDNSQLASPETGISMVPAFTDVAKKPSGRARARKSALINAPIRYEVKSISTSQASNKVHAPEAPMSSQMLEKSKNADPVVENSMDKGASVSRTPALEATTPDQSSHLLSKMDDSDTSVMHVERQRTPDIKIPEISRNNESSDNGVSQDRLTKQESYVSGIQIVIPTEISSSGKDSTMELEALRSSKQNKAKDNVQVVDLPNVKLECNKHESQIPAASVQVNFEAKENNMEPVIVRRRPEQKVSVTSKKAAARGTKHGSGFSCAPSVTAHSHEPRHEQTKHAASRDVQIDDKIKNELKLSQGAASVSTCSASEKKPTRALTDTSSPPLSSSIEVHKQWKDVGVSQGQSGASRDPNQHQTNELNKPTLAESQCLVAHKSVSLNEYVSSEKGVIHDKYPPPAILYSYHGMEKKDANSVDCLTTGNNASRSCSVLPIPETVEDESVDEDSVPPGFGPVLFPPSASTTSKEMRYPSSSNRHEDIINLTEFSATEQNDSNPKEALSTGTGTGTDCLNHMVVHDSVVGKMASENLSTSSNEDYSAPPGFSLLNLPKNSEDTCAMPFNPPEAIENPDKDFKLCSSALPGLAHTVSDQEDFVTCPAITAVDTCNVNSSCANVASGHPASASVDLSDSSQHVEEVASSLLEKSLVTDNPKPAVVDTSVQLSNGLPSTLDSAENPAKDPENGAGSSPVILEKSSGAATICAQFAETSTVSNGVESSMAIADGGSLLDVVDIPETTVHASSDNYPTRNNKHADPSLDATTSNLPSISDGDGNDKNVTSNASNFPNISDGDGNGTNVTSNTMFSVTSEPVPEPEVVEPVPASNVENDPSGCVDKANPPESKRTSISPMEDGIPDHSSEDTGAEKNMLPSLQSEQ